MLITYYILWHQTIKQNIWTKRHRRIFKWNIRETKTIGLFILVAQKKDVNITMKSKWKGYRIEHVRFRSSNSVGSFEYFLFMNTQPCHSKKNSALNGLYRSIIHFFNIQFSYATFCLKILATTVKYLGRGTTYFSCCRNS